VTNLNESKTADVVDVGQRFHIVFSIGYYGSLTILVMGLLHCFNQKHIRLFARGVGSCANYMVAIGVITGVVWRMIHTGEVCSGDFLSDKDPTKGYLITQGMLLLFILYLWMAMCALGIFCVCIAIVAKVSSHSQEQRT